jgi:hypothetical protein
MELRLFTPEQASALVPYLEAKVKRVRDTKRELDAAARQLEVLGLIADSGASEDSPDVRSRAQAEARLHQLRREIEEEAEAIQARGCLIKDLDEGLVDFYSLRGDRLVFLCWKLGEQDVTFWHALDGGFARRRPLEQPEA